MMVKTSKDIHLFSESENLILRAWFTRDVSTRPRAYDGNPDDDAEPGSLLDAALTELGIDTDPGQFLWRTDAAVAKILLHAVEHTLPQWGVVKPSGEVVTSRKYSDSSKHMPRLVELLPRNLFVIDWGGGPGNSWPDAYKLVWVPEYEQYVVTSSSDSPEYFGYCDFALGHFGKGVDALQAAGERITSLWLAMSTQADQEAWERVVEPGAVSVEQALAWRDSVWPSGHPEV